MMGLSSVRGLDPSSATGVFALDAAPLPALDYSTTATARAQRLPVVE